MANKIGTLYTTILNGITTNMNVYAKADTKEFEQIPAIGLGVHKVGDLEVTSRPHAVVVTIPIVIAHAGADTEVNIILSNIFEDFRALFHGVIATSLQGVGAESIVFGDFQEVPYNGLDNKIRCLGGEVSITLDISLS